MAKGAFIGVDGKARKIKKLFIGVDNKARKIKKMYIGDANGKARLFWSGGGDKLFMTAFNGTNYIQYISATDKTKFVEDSFVEHNTGGAVKYIAPFCVDGKYLFYYSESSDVRKVMYSDDLETWTHDSISTLIYYKPSYGERRSGGIVFYKNGRFVAFTEKYVSSTYTQLCLESADGLNWTEKGTVYTGSMTVKSLEYGLINSVMQYVLVTNKGVFYSSDLVSWTQKDTTSYSSVRSMTVDSSGEVFLLNSTTLYNLSTGNKGTVTSADLEVLPYPQDTSYLCLFGSSASKLVKKPTSTSGTLSTQTLYSRGTVYSYGKASYIAGVYYTTFSSSQTQTGQGTYSPSNLIMEYSTDATSWTRKLLKSDGGYSDQSAIKYEENY